MRNCHPTGYEKPRWSAIVNHIENDFPYLCRHLIHFMMRFVPPAHRTIMTVVLYQRRYRNVISRSKGAKRGLWRNFYMVDPLKTTELNFYCKFNAITRGQVATKVPSNIPRFCKTSVISRMESLMFWTKKRTPLPWCSFLHRRRFQATIAYVPCFEHCHLWDGNHGKAKVVACSLSHSVMKLWEKDLLRALSVMGEWHF